MFAQERDSDILDDPYLMLVDVHQEKDIFVHATTPEDVSDEPGVSTNTSQDALPKVFPIKPEQKHSNGDRSVVDAREFQRNFDIFTEYQLRFLNWDNVFLAGGSALACLQPIPGEHAKGNLSSETSC